MSPSTTVDCCVFITGCGSCFSETGVLPRSGPSSPRASAQGHPSLSPSLPSRFLSRWRPRGSVPSPTAWPPPAACFAAPIPVYPASPTAARMSGRAALLNEGRQWLQLLDVVRVHGYARPGKRVSKRGKIVCVREQETERQYMQQKVTIKFLSPGRSATGPA